jgi:hypothetical protein
MANYKVGQSIIAKISGIPNEVRIRAVLETTENKADCRFWKRANG